jgi:diaminopropionate ammonia-lyase
MATQRAQLSGRVTLNPGWVPEQAAVEPPSDAGAIEVFHASLPGFERTPLLPLPALADALGVERVWVKHERERLGLPSFKVVGASWAVNCALADRGRAAIPRTFADLTRMAAALPSGTTLATATDGNHGRAVAHVARLLELPSRIYVPTGTAQARIDAIASEGADVRVIAGSYDDTVRHAAAEAGRHSEQVLVSDTSWPGYETIPATVVDGYRTIFREACDQLAQAGGGDTFDMAFVPAGVGAFACSAVTNLTGRGCAVVTVEPTRADCVRRSLAAGEPVTVPGPHDSIMAGLNCGEVSRIAWPVLRTGVRAAVAVSDADSMDAMRALDAAGIPSGESGAAALAGATILARDAEGSALLRDDRCRTVLLLDTEGVTDPAAYAAIVGG